MAASTSGVLASWPFTYTSSESLAGTPESARAADRVTKKRQSIAKRRAYMAQNPSELYTYRSASARGSVVAAGGVRRSPVSDDLNCRIHLVVLLFLKRTLT